MSGQLPKVNAAFERQMETGSHVGAALAVTLDAEPYGVASCGMARPDMVMSEHVIVPWFSMTKLTMAMRVMMAWEAGAVHLDDPVAVYIPEFGTKGKKAITIRHVLTHTGGLRVADWPIVAGDWDTQVAHVCEQKLEDGWVPGRTAGYSLRAGAFILAEVVRRSLQDRRSWADMVRSDVLVPLGMTDSYLAYDPDTHARYAERTVQLVRMSTKLPPRRVPDPATGEDAEAAAVCIPGASGRGPLLELPRLVECLYLGGAPLLKPITVEAMCARHRTGLHDQTFNTTMDWGLGIIVDSKVHGEDVVPYGFGPHSGPRTFGHGGAQTSGVMCDPETGVSAAVFFNGMPGESNHNARVHQVFGAMYEDLGLV